MHDSDAMLIFEFSVFVSPSLLHMGPISDLSENRNHGPTVGALNAESPKIVFQNLKQKKVKE